MTHRPSADRTVPPEFRLPWRFDDGGREAAGFPAGQPDCVLRAGAIATGRPYGSVYSELASGRPIERGGIEQEVSGRFLTRHGFAFTACVGLVRLRTDELPDHPLMIVCLLRHLTVVKDGVVHDVADPVGQLGVWVGGWWAPTSG